MKIFVCIATFAVLAACGADGEPTRPTMNAGVSVTPSGVTPSVSVGTNVGPVWLNVGL